METGLTKGGFFFLFRFVSFFLVTVYIPGFDDC